MTIPFNRSTMVGNEERYLVEALRQGFTAGDGGFTRRCHALLESEHPGARVFLTTSCTDALEMAAVLLDIEPGDEVIVPAFTFVSTVNAFVLRGARPVFVDIRPDTLNLDENLLERALGSRTRAIVPVHYAGVGCELDRIAEVAGPVPIVEDNAHGLFGRYRGRALGTLGRLATLSFHQTKNFSCGEGGALLINDPSLLARAEIVREKGTDRSRFFRGEVDKYGWVDVGSSYLPSDLLAAVLLAQLERRAHIQATRRRIWERYATELAGWAERTGVRLPVVPPHCEQTYHLFYLLFPSLREREAWQARARAAGVGTAFHYQPLHLSTMGRRFGGRPGDCPVTEQVSDRLVRLPLFNDLADADVDRVIEVATS